jgi:formylglycine-generating enzyme required for sulfatase activity
VENDVSVCALARRIEWDKAKKSRWKTELQPGGSVTYVIYAETYQGAWQSGLRMMFQRRYLYDLEHFDNSMFEREDLQWIRNKYTIALQFAWDHDFYDVQNSGFRIEEYLNKGSRFFGGWDVLGLWPTWPTLGLDRRNQWDLYADLPGGLSKIRELSHYMQKKGTKFFIAYNPWDQSTRQVNHYRAMAQLLKEIDANGVILDTRGSSSRELQIAADAVKPGIVMYSEGMAVPKDMPGIVAGRVHDAIYMPPPLNLNKFIKPDFAIFRVCQLNQGRLHREFAISFFNGYGIEMNVFAPGRPNWIEEEYLYWGKLVRILRENSSVFLNPKWTPLIPAFKDSIWVNKWPSREKTLYTIYSLIPEGFNGPLFMENFPSDSHYVSLYHHAEILPDTIDGQLYLRVLTEAFNDSWLGTRREGNVDCIAKLPRLLSVNLNDDYLQFCAEKGTKILIWAGMPSYQSVPKEYSIGTYEIKLLNVFGRYEGKFVIQLMGTEGLLDEQIVHLEPGTPRLISRIETTARFSETPAGMIKVPSGEFTFKIEKKSSFIPYPDFSQGIKANINSFFIDKYPVTNQMFKKFLDDCGYRPGDTVNFLKHWINGDMPEGQENYPVVYVSYEDAQAYASWTGQRLPTEVEWQYAAQGSDERLWPCGSALDSSKCNVGLDKLTAVDAFPDGKSPFGVVDLVGNVWQLTNDVYDNGSHYFIIIRGGSYYDPKSSWWYVRGGPQPLNQSQMLIRVSQGFERNATVGFRCVVDAD